MQIDSLEEVNMDKKQPTIKKTPAENKQVGTIESQPKTQIAQVKNFISSNYDIRFDNVALKYEWKQKDENTFKELNENDLYCILLENRYKIKKDLLLAILNSSWIKPYDPLLTYFEGLENGTGKQTILSI